MEATADALAGEQTWPSEAEIDHAMSNPDAGTAEGAGRLRRHVPGQV